MTVSDNADSIHSEIDCDSLLSTKLFFVKEEFIHERNKKY